MPTKAGWAIRLWKTLAVGLERPSISTARSRVPALIAGGFRGWCTEPSASTCQALPTALAAQSFASHVALADSEPCLTLIQQTIVRGGHVPHARRSGACSSRCRSRCYSHAAIVGKWLALRNRTCPWCWSPPRKLGWRFADQW